MTAIYYFDEIKHELEKKRNALLFYCKTLFTLFDTDYISLYLYISKFVKDGCLKTVWG